MKLLSRDDFPVAALPMMRNLKRYSKIEFKKMRTFVIILRTSEVYIIFSYVYGHSYIYFMYGNIMMKINKDNNMGQ